MRDERHTLRTWWKPDGCTVHPENEARLKKWMRSHGLSLRPGAISMLLHSPIHESTRRAAAKAMTEAQSRSKT